VIEVVWTPSRKGEPEPYLKALGSDNTVMRAFYAYHTDELGRKYYSIPDSAKNRELAASRGPGWALLTAKPEVTEDVQRERVVQILTSLGIPHRSNMKFETLVHKLPVGMRGGFLP
jgi:hypothetical protein